MIGRTTLAALLSAASLLAQTAADTPRKMPDQPGCAATRADFRKLRVDGQDVHDAVGSLLRSIRWHSGLRGALRAAADSRKPLLWIEALGDLRGYT